MGNIWFLLTSQANNLQNKACSAAVLSGRETDSHSLRATIRAAGSTPFKKWEGLWHPNGIRRFIIYRPATNRINGGKVFGPFRIRVTVIQSFTDTNQTELNLFQFWFLRFMSVFISHTNAVWNWGKKQKLEQTRKHKSIIPDNLTSWHHFDIWRFSLRFSAKTVGFILENVPNFWCFFLLSCSCWENTVSTTLC